MPRIRSIKPELPQDEKLGNVSRDARLLFVLLLTIADDYGRFRGKPVYLKGQLFPYDDGAGKQPVVTALQVTEWLEELASGELVRLYEVGGQAYGEFVNWNKHQRIDNAGKSSIPPIPQSAATRGDSPRFAAGCGKEGIGEERDHNAGARLTVVSVREQTGFNATDCALIVANHLRITKEQTVETIRKQLVLEATRTPGGTFEAITELMMRQADEFTAAKPKLKYEWGWGTFFGDGYWADKTRWPWKGTNGEDAIARAIADFRESDG